MSDYLKLCVNVEKYLTRDLVLLDFENSDHRDLFALLVSSYEDLTVKKEFLMSLEKAKAVQQRTWELLNVGLWCDVPFITRRIYASACLIKVNCILRLGYVKNTMEVLSDALSAADDGLLLGSGLRDQLTSIASLLSDATHSEWMKSEGYLLDSLKTLEYKEKQSDWDKPGVKGEMVPSLRCPSLESFSLSYFKTKRPIKLTGCIDHWPALNKWKDIAYLLKVGGGRKVPVEIGSQYTQSDWGMKLCTLRKFITDHILCKNHSLGYLAQHQLFNQVPELYDDIRIPEYCCLSDSDNDPSVDINAWFGPEGTVSPLHHDPKHNLLTQVIGRKRIILYDPKDSSNLYPFEGQIMSNTSEVDPENPDYLKYPELTKTVAYECHLYPGEMLYIPPKWWHHVRALDVSFSVSFWWI